MEKYALLIDYKYCTGCHSCEIACRNEKEVSLPEWGIKIVEQGPEKLAGKWAWNFYPELSALCDLCESRLEEGKKPACAHHCLAKCIEAVPVSELTAKALEYGNGAAIYLP